MKVSVLMPVFNEQRTLSDALDRLFAVPFPCERELVVVDDASTDETPRILSSYDHPALRVVTHPVNRGKGAAIRTAAEHASGDFVIPCDADLEYRPEEIPMLLEPVLDKDAEVVFGVRRLAGHSAYSLWYTIGNHGITTAANLLFNAYIRDLETCFKLLPRALYHDLRIRSDGFGMEAEITGKLLARGITPYEIPISYRARTRQEGKKITWRDGVEAIWILLRIRAGRY